MSIARQNLNDRNPHATFAIFFVIFSLCLMLILYSTGTKYYEALQMSVPSATSWFQALFPWPMIAFSLLVLFTIHSMRSRLGKSSITKMSWAIIGATALVTLLGAFQLVSPMLTILSGMGEL